MKIQTTAMGIALIAVLGLTACTPGGDEPGQSKTVLNIGSTVGPQTFDPAGVGEANFVPYAQAAYDSLILREPDGKYVPMLATSWEVAENNTAVTLELRSDVTFSDGTEFNADAVKANLEHFKAGGGPLSPQLALLQDIEVVDADTITLNYSTSEPDILFSLSDAAGRMASPEALGSEDLASVPVGSGPYVMDVDATVQGSTYTFSAREGYWNPDLQKFDTVVFKIFPDEVSMLNALQGGQVDAANLTAPDNRAAATAAGIKHLTPDANISWTGILFFDRDGAMVPALGDERVRRAIAQSFNIEQIQTALMRGTGVPNTQIFNQASPGYDTDLNNAYPYDVDEAKSLMAEAGYADGFDLTIPINGNTSPAAQENLKNSLGAIGIRVTLENTGTIPQYIGALQSGKYAMTSSILGAVPTDWTVIRNTLLPTSPWNPMGSSDPELEKLIESYPGASGDEQGKIISKINNFLIDNTWFAPWLWVEEQFFVAGDIDVQLQLLQNVPSIYNYAPASK